MRIGIDYRALQVGHQLRGIGEVARQVTKGIAARMEAGDELVLFEYDHMQPVPIPYLPMDRTRIVPVPAFSSKYAKLLHTMTGAQERVIRQNCDVFVQFDFNLGVPARHRNVLVVHDQIPIEFGNKYPFSYLANYKVARHAGIARRHALEKQVRRTQYIRSLKDALNKSTVVLANSEYTNRTTRQYASKKLDIRTMLLGYGQPESDHQHKELLALERAQLHEFGLEKNNFLFFIGGVDDRRNVSDLVHAFNNIRGHGGDLKLVLAGHDFQSLDHIYSPRTRRAIEQSSYRDDIYLMGYVSDAERTWFYKHALAFVFPTEAEGFGMPILEALALGSPVVTYNNTAIPEVAGPNCHLVKGWEEIRQAVLTIADQTDEQRSKGASAADSWVGQFTWDRSSDVAYAAIIDAAGKKR